MYFTATATESPALADAGGVIINLEISLPLTSIFHLSSSALPLFSLSNKVKISSPEASALSCAPFMSSADLSVGPGLAG